MHQGGSAPVVAMITPICSFTEFLSFLKELLHRRRINGENNCSSPEPGGFSADEGQRHRRKCNAMRKRLLRFVAAISADRHILQRALRPEQFTSMMRRLNVWLASNSHSSAVLRLGQFMSPQTDFPARISCPANGFGQDRCWEPGKRRFLVRRFTTGVY
jgi:hypothetical protein